MKQPKPWQGLLLLLIIGLIGCQEEKLTTLDAYNSRNYFGQDIITLEDSGCIIATNYQNIIRLNDDANDKVVWEKKVTEGRIKSIVADKEAAIILAEEYNLNINKNQDTSITNYLKIIKISKTGATIWEVIDTSIAYVNGMDIIRLGNESFGILGMVRNISINDSLENSRVLALKINSNGKVIWKKIFNDVGDPSQSVSNAKMVKTSEGGMVLAFNTRFKIKKNYHPLGFCILKLNNAGNLVWNKKIIINDIFTKEELNFTPSTSFLNLVTNSKEDYLLTGQETFNTWGIKFNTNGEVLWKKILDWEHLHYTTDVIAINDDLFVAHGSLRGSGAESKSYIMLIGFDGEGKTLWEHKDEVKERSHGYALCEGFNNDIFITGGELGGYFQINKDNPLIMRRYKIKDME